MVHNSIDLSIKDLMIAFGFLLLNAMFNLIVLITIKIYTPFHILIIFIVGEFEIILNGFDDWKTYIIFIILCIIFFMILIFNEIIELNFCDLSYNVKRNSVNRSTLELLDSYGNDNDTEIDYDENEEDNNDN